MKQSRLLDLLYRRHPRASIFALILFGSLAVLLIQFSPWTTATSQARLDADFPEASQTGIEDICSPLIDPAAAQQLTTIYDCNGIYPDQLGFEVIAYAGDGASVTTVPIPAAAWLFGSGLLGLIVIARRKKAA